MNTLNKNFISGVSAGLVMAGLSMAPLPASALVIDNDIAAGTVGHWSVDMWNGGESRSADLTANRQASADTFTEDVLYDYFTYINVGSGGFRLGDGSQPVSSGDDEVTSSGSFLGSAGNTINWSVVSSIADGASTLVNTFSFSAETGTLGSLRLFQYMDEDVESVSDDVFFTRGSVAGLDLELFTVDDTEVYGVSHSGALDVSQGLVDAIFAGWGMCEFDEMRPDITDGSQAVSGSGVICGLMSAYVHPDIGASYGPQDIVSVLAWDVLSGATSATIITTLGGVPDISDIPDEENGHTIPEPTSILLFGAGLAGLGALRRRRTTVPADA